VWLLARREFTERGRSKPFIVTMALLAVVIIAVGPITNALSGGEPDATIVGLVGDQLDGIEDELVVQGTLFGIEIEVETIPDTDDFAQMLEDDDVDAVLVDGDKIVFYENDSTRLTAIVQRSLDAVNTRAALNDLGLSDEEIASVEEPSTVTVTTVEELGAQDDAKRAAAFFGAIILYVSIIMFGQFVAMGTVEEKQNRVVEVVLSRVRSWQVLVGKVAGIGLLGLVQLVILAGAAYISAQLADLADIDVSAIGLPIIASVIFWFILGYAFYAFLYAAVGSTVSRQEDLQGALMLPIVLILPGYLFAISAIENPDALVPRIASLMPMWAPFVMPVRIAAGSVPAWEVAIAVVGSIAGAVALVWIGSRVYRGALLRTGTKVKLRDAWKAAAE
jgi:ABC-2 type transport system permease protein